jgi:hypothetical protein
VTAGRARSKKFLQRKSNKKAIVFYGLWHDFAVSSWFPYARDPTLLNSR